MNPDGADPDAPVLGVLGGMGPMAGAWFMVRLTALTPAERDQDHVPAVLWSDPRIPDRSSFRMHQGPDPWPLLRQSLLALARTGVQAIAIPCNTAHAWYAQMREVSPVPILHIVQAVVDDLQHKGITRGRIGLLGTEATLALGLYQQELEARGYECLLPDPAEHARHCAPAIALVKQNRIGQSHAPARAAVEALRRRGAQAVVLGCTELPIALPEEQRHDLGLTVVDSIDALATAAIDWYARAKLSWRR